jgi:hypothetical protein
MVPPGAASAAATALDPALGCALAPGETLLLLLLLLSLPAAPEAS